jgi:hypothetical protein
VPVEIHYGAWVQISEDRYDHVVHAEEADFRLLLQEAFARTNSIGEALDLVKQHMVSQVARL